MGAVLLLSPSICPPPEASVGVGCYVNPYIYHGFRDSVYFSPFVTEGQERSIPRERRTNQRYMTSPVP